MRPTKTNRGINTIQVSYRARHQETGSGFIDDLPNSAGGMSVLLGIKNLSEKTIKCCMLYFVPINAVGDKVACSITGKVENGVRVTDPLAQKSSYFSANL